MPERRFAHHTVELSRLDKVLFPGSGITKGELIDYHLKIAAVMLPHLRDRPLSLLRFPDGIDASGFMQQQRPDYFPDWIPTCETPRASGDDDPVVHVMCNGKGVLAYLINQGTITLHGWSSRASALDRPDRLIFDLDPPGDDFEPVRQAARLVIELMQQLHMNPYLMTTGSRGLHVVAPLRIDAGHDEVRELARDMAAWLESRHPDTLTAAQRKAERRGRL